jgi:hypothetical protein
MNRKFLLVMSMFFIKLINNYFNKLYISQKINSFSQSFTAFGFRLEPKKPSIETLFEDFLPELRKSVHKFRLFNTNQTSFCLKEKLNF